MLLNFNAQTVAPSQPLEALPPGWYTARIVESEEKPTSKGDGAYLQLQLEVIAPAQFSGRKLWDRLNLKNPNPTAVEIAFQTLSAICHATGVLQLGQSQQLHGIPLEVKVGMSKVTPDYPDPRNEVKGYRSVQGSGAVVGAGQQMTAPRPMAAPAAAPVAQPQAAWQPQPQAQAQPQAPAQPMQQAQPQAAWQPQAQQPVAQPMQQAAPVEQVVQQPAWAGNAPQQGAQPVAQAQPVQQGPAPEITVAQQPATDPAAQQAATAGLAPWQVQ